jgi:hypothetical protein
MKHDLNLTLKMYKVVFSDKQITEIKRKMHIDNIFTYSDSEIALKVCRNKLRIKLNRRPLCAIFQRIMQGSRKSSFVFEPKSLKIEKNDFLTFPACF